MNLPNKRWLYLLFIPVLGTIIYFGRADTATVQPTVTEDLIAQIQPTPEAPVPQSEPTSVPPAEQPAQAPVVQPAQPKAAPKPVAPKPAAPAPAPQPVQRTYPNPYPAQWANAPMDSLLDTWVMYNRECVSYAAFRAASYNRFPRSMHGADANLWPSKAQAAGIPVSSSPRVNSAGVKPNSKYGHVVWVERVNGDGTIDVTQYNKAGNGHFSYETVPASTYSSYIYF